MTVSGLEGGSGGSDPPPLCYLIQVTSQQKQKLSANVGSMLAYRLRRWLSVDP